MTDESSSALSQSSTPDQSAAATGVAGVTRGAQQSIVASLPNSPIDPSHEPMRESPAPEPLHCGLDDPSHPSVPDEPVLNIENIQGNILTSFMKDNQALVFLTFNGDENTIEGFKEWLAATRPFIATVAEVMTFNRLFKEIRTRRKCEPTGIKATWINIAFSIEGIRALAAGTGLGTDFEDEAFTQGLAHRSLEGSLGDPSRDNQKDAEGHPQNWLIGGVDADGNKKVLDVVVIIASDDPSELDITQPNSTLNQIKDGYIDPTGCHHPGLKDFGHIIVQFGRNLPSEKNLAGHEHFGFLDGVSQPGVRGRLSDDIHDVLTSRQNPNNRDQGKPGQELIWPGEFVFGYPQSPSNPQGEEDPKKKFQSPGPISTAGPDWANDGSFLVFRRLRQDVGTFHKFLNDTAKALKLNDPPPLKPGVDIPPGTPVGDSAADIVGARFVGRWRSGAPVLRTRHPEVKPDGAPEGLAADPVRNDQDNPFLAGDDCANNNFEFQESTEPLPRTALKDPFDCADENDPEFQGPEERRFQPAHRDEVGAVCPFTGHIRKAYPRDDKALERAGNLPPLVLDGQPVTNEEGEEIITNEDDTQTHRILRRGIPFGKASDSTPGNPKSDALDKPIGKSGEPTIPKEDPTTIIDSGRGLLFLAYQTSIEDQFEFIIQKWVNNPDFKEPEGKDPTTPPTHLEPKKQGGGHDPIIGQNNKRGEDRVREFTIAVQNSAGKRSAVRVSTKGQAQHKRDWVIPTGGEYFFSPSIDALGKLSGAD